MSEEQQDITLTGPITIDLGAIKDEPVADGWHSVEIERAEPKLSSEKKLPQIFVLSRIIDEADPDYHRTVVWNSMLKGDGLVFTKRCFKALGLPEVLDYPDAQALADDMVGRRCQAKCKRSKEEDSRNVNVNDWKRPDELEFSF